MLEILKVLITKYEEKKHIKFHLDLFSWPKNLYMSLNCVGKAVMSIHRKILRP